MTSSAGASGLTLVASPPRSRTASRIVARSTTQGTPVKSCISTRAGVNWISMLGSASGSQPPERPDVVGGDVRAVLGAEQVLEQDLQAVGEPVVPLHGVDLVDLVARVSDAELALRTEGVEARHVALLEDGLSFESLPHCARSRWTDAPLSRKPYVRLVKQSSVKRSCRTQMSTLRHRIGAEDAP